MTLEADTLVQLTEALKKRGVRRFTDVTFLRAPYRRHDQRWVCSVK